MTSVVDYKIVLWISSYCPPPFVVLIILDDIPFV